MNASSSVVIPRVTALLLLCLALPGCELTDSGEGTPELRIGANFEITGALPDVGEQALFAAEMFVDDVNAAGGVAVGDTRYALTLIVADNEATPEEATAATERLIVDDDVLVVVGPNLSNAAIPAGAVANDRETLLISPWSTNPATTLDRPWVFRVPFLDTFQGPVLAGFASDHYGATRACVLFDAGSDYPRGLAESFKEAWEARHGAASVAAYESFATGEDDLGPQLTRIRDAGCDVFFVPQYANEVPRIVAQAHALGITAPILGSDAWGGEGLIEECGAACEGYFFSAHYVAAGATGDTRAFIDRYEAAYGEVPGDVAALTWDALQLVRQALQNCGTVTGDLAADRACVRAGMAAVQDFDGVTGTISYDAQGDPIKCVVMVRIENGAFTAAESVCP